MIMINQNQSVQSDSSSSLSVCELLTHPKVEAIIANKIGSYGINDRDDAVSVSRESILRKYDKNDISTLEEGIHFASKEIHNTVRNLSRTERLRDARFIQSVDQETDPYECKIADPTTSSEWYHIPEINGVKENVWSALLRLDQKFREVLIAVEMNGETHNAVCKRLGLRRQAVGKRLEKAKKLLREDGEIIELKKHYN